MDDQAAGTVSLLTYVLNHWAVISAVAAGIFGYGRLSQRVTSNTKAIDRIEKDMGQVLRDIRDDIKAIHKKVDSQKDEAHQMHVSLLERLNPK